MSEDVSATMRVGITVILVAALVAVVLNLMVMSNSLLSNGQTTLQSGIDSVSAQEFSVYDNVKVSGTQVATAINLFNGRDVAIIIQTKSFRDNVSAKLGLNYGALLTSDGTASSTTNKPTELSGTVGAGGALTITGTGTVKGTTETIDATKAGTFITNQALSAYVVGISETATATAVSRNKGASFYTGQLYNENGLVTGNYDTIGTTELGNAAFLLSSSRFSSTLIKDSTGSIIGIVFIQLK